MSTHINLWIILCRQASKRHTPRKISCTMARNSGSNGAPLGKVFKVLRVLVRFMSSFDVKSIIAVDRFLIKSNAPSSFVSKVPYWMPSVEKPELNLAIVRSLPSRMIWWLRSTVVCMLVMDVSFLVMLDVRDCIALSTASPIDASKVWVILCWISSGIFEMIPLEKQSVLALEIARLPLTMFDASWSRW